MHLVEVGQILRDRECSSALGEEPSGRLDTVGRHWFARPRGNDVELVRNRGRDRDSEQVAEITLVELGGIPVVDIVAEVREQFGATFDGGAGIG